MGKHLRYIKYVCKHKWYVFIECCKLGIPFRGLVHDLSKLMPIEWIPYADRFHSKFVINKKVDEGFKVAFLHHMQHNPHHWQYWLKVMDEPNAVGDFVHSVTEQDVQELEGEVASGFTKKLSEKFSHVFPAPMPDKYRREMLADWRGAGKAITGKEDALGWYKQNKDNMILHEETRAWIEEQLGYHD